MSQNKLTDQFDRRVIPRWRESGQAAQAGELTPVKERAVTAPRSFDNEITRVKADLVADPSPGVAAEALSMAILAGDKTLAAAAKTILWRHEFTIPTNLRKLLAAPEVIDLEWKRQSWGCTASHSKTAIRKIRNSLAQYPRNPILYLDLARNFSVLGLKEKAEQAVKIAMSLAPENRHVLRAAARFFITEDQAAYAHRILSTNKLTPHDPWLMAAEVATAQVAKRSPKFFKAGKHLIERRSLKPIHLSELSAAIGTIEFLDGRKKDAKRLFEMAVVDPTENALAQAKWAEGKMCAEFERPKGAQQVKCAHEAQFIIEYYLNGDIESSQEHVVRWLMDEPFSEEAVIMNGYIYSLFDNYKSTIEVCDFGLRRHHDHPCLQYNKIFAELSSNLTSYNSDEEKRSRLIKIHEYLHHEAEKPDADIVHIVANQGLMMYRLGFYEEGKKLYENGIKWAKSKGEKFSQANALIFHAREAILSKTEWAESTLREASDFLQSAKAGSAGQRFYLEKLKELAKQPDEAARVLSSQNVSAASKPKRTLPKLGVDFHIQPNSDGTVTLFIPSGNKFS